MPHPPVRMQKQSAQSGCKTVHTFLGLFGVIAALASGGTTLAMGGSVWSAGAILLAMGMSIPLLFVIVLAAFAALDAVAPFGRGHGALSGADGQSGSHRGDH